MKANILLVNDRPEQLAAMEAALEALQENIILARSGDEALRHLLHHDFAVVLLDVRMPGMDGFETAVLMRLRERNRATPIIFVTAYGQDDAQVRRSYSLGAVDYIQTPILPEILRAKVGVFVELYKKSEELRAQVNEVTSINKELEAFSYSISHDLRAPLRSMQSFAQLLASDYGQLLPESGKKMTERIIQSSRYMDHLLHDLLEYSRLSQSALTGLPVSLETELDGVLASIQQEIQEKNAVIEIHRPLDTVLAHQATLKQILSNLISNALKFVEPGQVPHVEICSELKGGRVRLWMKDNGIGIPKDQHEKIFGIFQRVDKQYEGTGIGLAIVKKAVTRMGGHVGVDSDSGQGSMFWIDLPSA